VQAHTSRPQAKWLPRPQEWSRKATETTIFLASSFINDCSTGFRRYQLTDSGISSEDENGGSSESQGHLDEIESDEEQTDVSEELRK